MKLKVFVLVAAALVPFFFLLDLPFNYFNDWPSLLSGAPWCTLFAVICVTTPPPKRYSLFWLFPLAAFAFFWPAMIGVMWFSMACSLAFSNGPYP